MSEIVRDREKQYEIDRWSLREREKERLEEYLAWNIWLGNDRTNQRDPISGIFSLSSLYN